jgi:hypothetical protein
VGVELKGKDAWASPAWAGSGGGSARSPRSSGCRCWATTYHRDQCRDVLDFDRLHDGGPGHAVLLVGFHDAPRPPLAGDAAPRGLPRRLSLMKKGSHTWSTPPAGEVVEEVRPRRGAEGRDNRGRRARRVRDRSRRARSCSAAPNLVRDAAHRRPDRRGAADGDQR